MKYIVLALAILASACSQTQTPPTLSSNVHGLPEDGAPAGSDDLTQDEAQLGPVTDDYVDATSAALDQSEVPVSSHSLTAGDRVPWHMEYLLTDLSVSASGLLGSLVMKGSPSVTFIWRKQKPAAIPLDVKVDAADVSMTNATTHEEMAMQIEPAVRMAVASGRVKNETKLRSSLLSAANDFQALAASVGENPGHDWWVSRLRLDLTLDATGAVTPVIGVGGDIRFRFEWHRIMKANASTGAPKTKLLGVAPSDLREFISATAEDLSVLSDTNPKPDGFKAYSYRVGLGVSAKGDIGVVKSTASLMGQVYFSRDVAKPKVHNLSAEVLPDTINVIEDASAAAETHARYASENAIATERVGNQIVYKVDRKKIRKGLARAAKMGILFGKHAGSAKGHWKVFELRTALDLSITGKVGLTELSGLATSEINFYNQSF